MTDTAAASTTPATSEAAKGAAAPSADAAAPVKGALDAAKPAATDATKDQAAPPAADQTEAKPGGYRPDGLPEHLLGMSDKETIDNLKKAYEGARGKIAEGVPKTPDEYEFKPSEEAAKLFGADLKADPVLTALRAQAHAAGLKGTQFDAFLNGAIPELTKLGIVTPPIDQKADLEALRDQLRGMGRAHDDQAVTAEIAKYDAFIDVFGKQAGLDPAAIQTMKAFADLPAGYPVLRAIEKALGAAPIAMGGGGAAAQWTKESLRAAQADPRADMNSPKYDAKFAAEIDRGYQQLYGRGNG
jgi:hypothetical protein